MVGGLTELVVSGLLSMSISEGGPTRLGVGSQWVVVGENGGRGEETRRGAAEHAVGERKVTYGLALLSCLLAVGGL